jgi:hypothetical protein
MVGQMYRNVFSSQSDCEVALNIDEFSVTTGLITDQVDLKSCNLTADLNLTELESEFSC